MRCTKYYYTIIAFLLLISCKKDFLDVKNNSSLYRQSYVKDLISLKDFLNGIYQVNAQTLENSTAVGYPEIIADNLKSANIGDGLFYYHYSWIQDPNGPISEFGGAYSAGMDDYWHSGYRLIRACNFVIEDVDLYSKENPTLANDMAGQSYALRAYFHYKLLDVFAQAYVFTANGSHPGIPYITTSDISKPYSRQSVAEVCDAMIEDLKKAILLLPENPKDSRMMNSLAAKGLLARVYLYKGDYASAKITATEVTNRVPLLSASKGYPDDIFKFKDFESTETLFQVAPAENPPFLAFLGANFGDPSFMLATSDIALALKENSSDIRSSWVVSSGSNWEIRKFPVVSIPGINSIAGSYYTPVIRTSELYLIIAECAAKLGDESMARQYLTSIVQRSISGAAAVTESGDALMNLIRSERRKELCFEGLRMADLQRWKLGVHRIDAPISAAKDLPFGNDKAIAPIPQSDVKLMGIPQNSGY